MFIPLFTDNIDLQRTHEFCSYIGIIATVCIFFILSIVGLVRDGQLIQAEINELRILLCAFLFSVITTITGIYIASLVILFIVIKLIIGFCFTVVVALTGRG